MTINTMIFLCLSSISIHLQAQSLQDLEAVQGIFRPSAPISLTQRYQDTKNNPNELQMLLSGLFLTYKSCFSSQDGMRCSFHPSCSEFGLLAVKKKGVVFGMIATMDRLTRCNGLSADHYDLDPKRGVLLDPCD
jgi:uncharacterized protein